MRVEDCFVSGGWDSVWRGVSNGDFEPEQAAKFAEMKARELEGRPPLDPFWLEGDASRKRMNLSVDMKARTLLAWLNRADTAGGWEPERLGFEVMYLLTIKFVNWTDEANWRGVGDAKTLAEAVLFEIPREDVFGWNWDWGAIRTEWWSSILENHPSKAETALSYLESNREHWDEKECELAKAALDVWEKYPKKRDEIFFGNNPINPSIVAAWEKILLSSETESTDKKHQKAL